MSCQAQDSEILRESSSPSGSARFVASQAVPNSSVIQTNATVPSVDVHTLRPSEQYVSNNDITSGLKTAFFNAFRYFQSGLPIPTSILAKLDSFTVDSNTFLRLTRIKELNGGRHIYLEDGKIKFFTFTQPPHAEIIGRVLRQISRQDIVDLFIDGSGGGILIYINLLISSRRPIE